MNAMGYFISSGSSSVRMRLPSRRMSRAVSCLPLVDQEGRLQGLATRTDLYRTLHRDSSFDSRIAALCSSKVYSVAETDPVRRALEILRRRGIKHVPVVAADGRITGMISFRDVLREAIRLRDANGALSGR